MLVDLLKLQLAFVARMCEKLSYKENQNEDTTEIDEWRAYAQDAITCQTVDLVKKYN